MSCAFRALPRIIAELILAAPKSSEVVIISPWIREVILKPPVIGTVGNWNTKREMSLSQLLLFVVEHRNLDISIVSRDLDRDISTLINPLIKNFPKKIRTYQEPFLHAKVIVTNSTVLQMSANLIPTSLYRNIENCSLCANKFKNSRKYVQNELKLKL